MSNRRAIQAKTLLEITHEDERVHLHFHHESLFHVLCGVHDEHLAALEYVFGVTLMTRGNHLVVTGEEQAKRAAVHQIHAWYEQLHDGRMRDASAMAAAVVQLKEQHRHDETSADYGKLEKIGSKAVGARSSGQSVYMDLMRKKTVVFACGPAGSGKTYLAVAYGVGCLLRGEVERLVLARPAVEAGERLGFLPGDVKDKIDPYLRPLYDCLRALLTKEQWQRLTAQDAIEVAPLAFMRGRTLNRSFVILDEAQNATSAQLRMCLTRLGEDSRMVVTADPSQIDLPQPHHSGIHGAEAILRDVPMVAFVHLTARDVMRHRVVRAIVAAYQKADTEES